jgi:beta-glucosidase
MIKHCLGIILLFIFSTFLSYASVNNQSIYQDGWIDFNKNGKKDVFEDPTQEIQKRVEDLLSQMTVNEKTCQLATLYGYGRVLKDSLPTANWKNEIWKDGIANIDEQLNGVGKGFKTNYDLIYPFSNHVFAINKIQKWFVEETRLGIPVDFSNEGIHGLNHTKATPLPAPIAIGSTWNPALVRKAGEIAGKEAKALGYTNVYAPILDVARDQRWGRTLECYGEDPFLVATLGTEMVKGIQSQGVASTLKHFAVYSVPKGARDGNCRTDPHVSPREMHQIHLYPFEKVIKNAKPMGVMASYNDWNGVPVIANSYFLVDLLRKKYGFDGFVVSDSEAVEFVFSKHKVAPDYDDAVRQVLEAGMNVRTHFTPPADFILPIRRLIAGNKISMEVIDQRVREVLSVKFRMGLFDKPYVEDAARADKIVGADKNQDFVLDMQQQSLVLLKNEKNLLPLDKNKLKKILVTGPLADEDNFMVSRYGPNGLKTITVLDGIKNYLSGTKTELYYEKGCGIVNVGWPESEIVPVDLTKEEIRNQNKALKLAKQSDVIIVVLGEDEYCTGESRSRSSLELPGHQQKYLEALYATGKPVVLVLINGQPLTINWANKYIPSILECWFPSYMGGKVIAETLFGENNPGGKLSVTFPKSIGQIQMNFPFMRGSHGGQPDSGPNGHGNTRVQGALYPFGYGLSYTTFEYKNFIIEPSANNNGEFEISVDIINTGTVKGDEIAQLYISDMVSSVVTYESQLRGFQRITLNPGETKTVAFTLKPEDFHLLDRNMNWVIEPGIFEIRIGANSEDIKLKTQLEINN